MIKYKVEGEYLDQFDKAEFAVTKAISKIGEIDLRHGDRSTNFKVPLTANNAKILRYTPNLNNYNSINNFARYNGQLIQDDAVISDGYFQVTKFNPSTKEIEMRFYGGNSDWFDLLKDRYINEVVEIKDSPFPYNLDVCNHIYRESSVVNSWNLSNNLPYYYFLNDNGKNTVKTDTRVTDISEWRLSVFEKVIFNEIFKSVGIKTEGSLFNDITFNSTVIPTVVDIEVAAGTQSNKNFSLEPFGQSISDDSDESIINFNIDDFDKRWNGNTFTADLDNTTISFNPFAIKIGFVGNLSDPFTIDCTLFIRGDVIAGVDAYTLGDIKTPGIDSGEWVFENDAFISYTLNAGQSISLTFNQGLNESRVVTQGELSYQTVTPTPKYVTISDITKFLPKIKQTDFIKDIMFRFGVVSQYDVKTKTLKLDKFEDIENNIPNAPDWTTKIDLSKDVNVDYTKILQNYAKRSIIDLIDDDNDVYNTLIRNVYGFNLGRGVIDINNDFLSDETDIYESPYASTLTIRTLRATRNNPNVEPTSGDFWLPFIPTNNYTGKDETDTPVYETQEVQPRVLIATGAIEVESFALSDSSISLDSVNYNQVGYAYFMKPQFKGLGSSAPVIFDLDNVEETLAYDLQTGTTVRYNGVTLLEKNYNLLRKILNDPLYVSMSLNLNNLDIQTIDFLTPIYLSYKYDSGYYYIDSIEQYKGDGTSTTVNLVKI